MLECKGYAVWSELVCTSFDAYRRTDYNETGWMLYVYKNLATPYLAWSSHFETYTGENRRALV